MKRRSVVAFSFVPLLAMLGVGWCTLHDGRMEARFERISSGMSPKQVVGILGVPSWDGICGAEMPTGLPASCVREFGYAAALAPLNPRYYLIWFGQDGRVVRTAPIMSP